MGRIFRYTRINGEVIQDSYDDSELRLLFIEFAKKILGLNFINGTIYGIDLINADDPRWGAEGENGSWDGNRWDSSQRDCFKLGIDTLNIQNWKWHYFGLGELSEKNGGNFLLIHEGYDKNIYFRVNAQLDQICLVDASVVRDLSKIKFAYNRKVSNSDQLEDWICIPKEFVRTFNKQLNGDWLEDGPYCGPTQQEIEDMKREYTRNRVKFVMANRKSQTLHKS